MHSEIGSSDSANTTSALGGKETSLQVGAVQKTTVLLTSLPIGSQSSQGSSSRASRIFRQIVSCLDERKPDRPIPRPPQADTGWPQEPDENWRAVQRASDQVVSLYVTHGRIDKHAVIEFANKIRDVIAALDESTPADRIRPAIAQLDNDILKAGAGSLPHTALPDVSKPDLSVSAPVMPVSLRSRVTQVDVESLLIRKEIETSPPSGLGPFSKDERAFDSSEQDSDNADHWISPEDKIAASVPFKPGTAGTGKFNAVFTSEIFDHAQFQTETSLKPAVGVSSPAPLPGVTIATTVLEIPLQGKPGVPLVPHAFFNGGPKFTGGLMPTQLSSHPGRAEVTSFPTPATVTQANAVTSATTAALMETSQTNNTSGAAQDEGARDVSASTSAASGQMMALQQLIQQILAGTRSLPSDNAVTPPFSTGGVALAENPLIDSGAEDAVLTGAPAVFEPVNASATSVQQSLPQDVQAGRPTGLAPALNVTSIETLGPEQLGALQELLALCAVQPAPDPGMLAHEQTPSKLVPISEIELAFLFGSGLAAAISSVNEPVMNAPWPTGTGAIALQAKAHVVSTLGVPVKILLNARHPYLVGTDPRSQNFAGIVASDEAFHVAPRPDERTELETLMLPDIVTPDDGKQWTMDEWNQYLDAYRAAVNQARQPAKRIELSLQPHAIGNIPAAEIAALDPMQRKRLLTDLSAEQVGGMTSSQFAAFSGSELEALKPKQLAYIGPYQTYEMNGAQLYALAKTLWVHYRNKPDTTDNATALPVDSIDPAKAVNVVERVSPLERSKDFTPSDERADSEYGDSQFAGIDSVKWRDLLRDIIFALLAAIFGNQKNSEAPIAGKPRLTVPAGEDVRTPVVTLKRTLATMKEPTGSDKVTSREHHINLTQQGAATIVPPSVPQIPVPGMQLNMLRNRAFDTPPSAEDAQGRDEGYLINGANGTPRTARQPESDRGDSEGGSDHGGNEHRDQEGKKEQE
jgi:hypothetical protein